MSFRTPTDLLPSAVVGGLIGWIVVFLRAKGEPAEELIVQCMYMGVGIGVILPLMFQGNGRLLFFSTLVSMAAGLGIGFVLYLLKTRVELGSPMQFIAGMVAWTIFGSTYAFVDRQARRLTMRGTETNEGELQ